MPNQSSVNILSWTNALCAALAFALLLVASTFAFDEEPTIKVQTKKTADLAEVKTANDKVVVDIHSPSGISSATMERIAERWPDNLVIRLHLGGLESFKLTAGELIFEGAVSSHNCEVKLWKVETEQNAEGLDVDESRELNTKSSHWIKVHMRHDSNDEIAKTIPLKDGYFELHLPKPIFEEQPSSITLSWIDFYRN